MSYKIRTAKEKIKPQSTLNKIAALARKNKKRIVFTNGCFDILHKGHVDYLQRSRRLGDLLIVALNSDLSVKKLKGNTRPIHTLKDRQFVIAALESVDYVTYFSEDTPLSIIKKIRPHILVKGGDWQIENIVGAKEVLSWGGSVKPIKFVDGHSTTGIINKTKQSK